MNSEKNKNKNKNKKKNKNKNTDSGAGSVLYEHPTQDTLVLNDAPTVRTEKTFKLSLSFSKNYKISIKCIYRTSKTIWHKYNDG